MRFKIDENLPVELAELLADARHEAVTVFAQHLQGQNGSRIAQVCGREGRVLITLDLDFADMALIPPNTTQASSCSEWELRTSRTSCMCLRER